MTLSAYVIDSPSRPSVGNGLWPVHLEFVVQNETIPDRHENVEENIAPDVPSGGNYHISLG
jgi:hypothetical protein